VRQASREGVIELAEGRWARAQQHLQRAAEDDPQPLMHYLGAARAANHQGLYSERDALLEKALNRQPKAELGIALTHAELQLASGQLLDAAQTLEAMRSRHPRHHLVLRHLQQLYVDTGAWSALLALLPDLRKEKVLVGDALASLERRAWLGYLSTLEQGADEAPEASLQAAWQRLSNDLRHDPELLAVYVERLRGVGAEVQAEEVLLQALKRHYDAHLVRLYGLLHGRDPAKQLQVAEGWLKAHGDDPALRLTLGRLCLHNQLWGKAREYLEASLLLERDPETCAELARLLAHLGDVEQSNQLFQEGLALLDRRLGGSVVVPARVG
jgi:HemY protein